MNFAASTLSSNSAIDQYIATLPNDAAIVVETLYEDENITIALVNGKMIIDGKKQRQPMLLLRLW